MSRKQEPRKSPLFDLGELEPQMLPPLDANTENWPKALPRFLERLEWTRDEWQEIRKHWLERPDDLTKRNRLLWKTAKMERYRAAPDLAIERQQILRSDEWMTAFLLAGDWDRAGIASFLLVELDSVDKLIRNIKDKAEVETQGGIVRWFLGL